MAKSPRRSAGKRLRSRPGQVMQEVSSSRFLQAVQGTPSLASAYRPGLQALAPADRERVRCKRARQLRGSVYVDEALRSTKPNDSRWDYAIGYRPKRSEEQIIWVEVHDAKSDSSLKEVESKLDWLIEWLETDAVPMNYQPRRIVWVATGASSFSANAPQLRKLCDRGLEFVGSRLTL